MDILEAFILGVVQGIAEFLPVSSSGHLALFKNVLGVKIKNPLGFDVMLHFGTLLSVLFVMRDEVKKYLTNKDLIARVVISFVFTVPVALFFERISHRVEENMLLLSFSFFFGALILFSTRFNLRFRFSDFLSYAFIGVMQGVAAVPGISRSGATISASLAVGMTPAEAFNFSFILSIPTIFSAIAYELMKVFLKKETFGDVSLETFFVAVLSSFTFGIISLLILRRIVIGLKLWLFGFYKIFISLISLFVFFTHR
ncbi:Undecaprenyl-diphosphatase [bacterium HR19]|nr:Undecaprenyl-diphosphatase [bacterium HR19]